MDKLLHQELVNDYRFKMILADIQKLSPIVPHYDPKIDNIELMKYHSARQQMFQTIVTALNPFNDKVDKT